MLPRWPLSPIVIHCVNYDIISLFIIQCRWPLSLIAIGYVNSGWLNAASWPLSSIAIVVCWILFPRHITDMVKVGLMTRKTNWYSLCEFWNIYLCHRLLTFVPRSHCSVNFLVILYLDVWYWVIEWRECREQKPLILWDALIHSFLIVVLLV
jgi:hypothetical protein